LRRLAWLIASVGGAGLVPVSPGSAGSLVAVVAGAGLLRLPPWVLPAAILGVTLLGLWAIRAAGADDDPGWVVIDEVAGQWIALLGLASASVTGLAAAFLVFRVIDIGKPGPVAWADRQKTPAGVMGDDLIAGAFAACVLWAVRSRWPGVLH
jgi:phosphatidylglycerophosphatase A